MSGYFTNEFGMVIISSAIIKSFIARDLIKGKLYRPDNEKPDAVNLSEDLRIRNAQRCVSVSFQDSNVFVTVEIQVQFGAKITEVASKLVEEIKRTIEITTGLNVAEVIVKVNSVYMQPEEI